MEGRGVRPPQQPVPENLELVPHLAEELHRAPDTEGVRGLPEDLAVGLVLPQAGQVLITLGQCGQLSIRVRGGQRLGSLRHRAAVLRRGQGLAPLDHIAEVQHQGEVIPELHLSLVQGLEVALLDRVLRVRVRGDVIAELGRAVLQGDQPHHDPAVLGGVRVCGVRTVDGAHRLRTVDHAGAGELEVSDLARDRLADRLDRLAEHGDAVAEIPEVLRLLEERVPDLDVDVGQVEVVADVAREEATPVLAVQVGEVRRGHGAVQSLVGGRLLNETVQPDPGVDPRGSRVPEDGPVEVAQVQKLVVDHLLDLVQLCKFLLDELLGALVEWSSTHQRENQCDLRRADLEGPLDLGDELLESAVELGVLEVEHPVQPAEHPVDLGLPEAPLEVVAPLGLH
ncbi:hypothetical protein SCYAM73S_04180 [Streptomyces cyaneofuscatus]